MRLSKGCPFSKIVFQTLILKMSEQKSYFKNLDYLGDRAQPLALKARYIKENRDIAMKLVEKTNEQFKNRIDNMKKKYKLLNKLSYNQYLVKIFDCFYLTDDDTQQEEEEIGQDNQNEKNQQNLFLVLKMETFMCKTTILTKI
ncbi:hypothetical protein ABPG72_020873 [Tetrahymena utriculariae]